MQPKDQTTCCGPYQDDADVVQPPNPVIDGAMTLGTWQGIYLIEHRVRPHRREVVMQFIGARS